MMSFNTFKRVLTDVMWCVSMFYSVNTKITNFSISGTSTSKIIYFFGFLDSTSKFFLTVNGTFLGAPFQDRTTFFFTTLVVFFGCVLEETHGTIYSFGSQKRSAECKEESFISGVLLLSCT